MTDAASEPIDLCLERWHAYVAEPTPERLDALLHDDAVFRSPIVFTPQRGKAITTLYLAAATHVFVGDHADFRYVREVCQGHDAVLEFETLIGDVHVNGVDMITCDDDGRIVDFTVMIRPLRAIEAVHQAMRRMLETG